MPLPEESKIKKPKLSFSLNDEQIEKLKEWQHNHKCKKKVMKMTGAKYTYLFTPTGIGSIEVVQCKCGKSIDLTNFENW